MSNEPTHEQTTDPAYLAGHHNGYREAVQAERQRSGRLVGRIKAACLALDDLREDPGYGVGVADAEVAVLAIVNEYLSQEDTP